MGKTKDYESQAYMDVLDELTELNTRYEMIGGYHYQAQTEKILLGLGFYYGRFKRSNGYFFWRLAYAN